MSINTTVESTTVAAQVESKVVSMADVVRAELEAAETLVGIKYPALNIVKGSMTQDKDHPHFGNKRRVQIVCNCGVTVERATSDLFTFIGCESCKKNVRKANKLAKKVILAQALAAAEAKAAE